MRERIVKIDKIPPFALSKKLSREIRIFNKMRLVMPCRHKVPVLYSQFLGRLVLEPRWVLRGEDAFLRLLYVCAAANLYAHTGESLVRRQLLKNIIYVFGMRDVFKSKRKFSLRQRFLNTYEISRFKYLREKFVSEKNRIDRPSYTFYKKDGWRVKHYIDKTLAVECFETNAEKFTHFVAADKLKYNLSHTADTFFATGEGAAVGLYAPDKVAFGSSICEKGDELKIYVNLSNTPSAASGCHPSTQRGPIYVIRGATKSDITATVAELKRRRGKLDYLLIAGEVREAAQIEAVFQRAWAGRFVRGDGLREKFAAACKYVPTLWLPTLVYNIERADDFFAVVDSFWLFRKIVAAGQRLNVIFMYSAMNDEVREIIKTFSDEQEARELIGAGVFLFFIDRVKAGNKAVNYLSLMGEVALLRGVQRQSNPYIETNVHISNTFPVTHTIYVRNTLEKARTAKVRIPLDVGGDLEGFSFGMPAVCKRVGANLQVTGLRHGKSSNYKLPAGAKVSDEFGRALGESSELACERVFVAVDVKLAAFEEKVLKIVRGEGGLSRAERKQAFLGSIEDIRVRAIPESHTPSAKGGHPFILKGNFRDKFCELFNLGIVDGEDTKLVTSLKAAIKDFQRDVFFALLAGREEITADVYAVLVERVLGIKLLRGKIQLCPKIAITGSFDLSFTYKDTPYNFRVTERGGGFSVNYGGAEHKNFLQVVLDKGEGRCYTKNS